MRMPSVLKPNRRTELPAPYTIKNKKRIGALYGRKISLNRLRVSPIELQQSCNRMTFRNEEQIVHAEPDNPN